MQSADFKFDEEKDCSQHILTPNRYQKTSRVEERIERLVYGSERDSNESESEHRQEGDESCLDSESGSSTLGWDGSSLVITGSRAKVGRGIDGGGRGCGPEGYRNILDFEYLGLCKDASEVLRVANQTDTETSACGPSTTRRVHFGGTQSAINKSGKNLLILGSWVGEHSGEVGSVGIGALPGQDLSTIVVPRLTSAWRGDGISQRGGEEGEEDSKSAHN